MAYSVEYTLGTCTDSLWSVPETVALLGERKRRPGRRLNQPFEFEALEPRILLSAVTAVAAGAAVPNPHEQRIEQPVELAPANPATANENGAPDGQNTPGQGAPADGFAHMPASKTASLFDVPDDPHFEPPPTVESVAAPEEIEKVFAQSELLEATEMGDILSDQPGSDEVGARLVAASPGDDENGPMVAANELPCLAPGVRQVGGELSANETWSGTIHVTSDVTIQPGATLTITPGTVVKFGQGRYLLARGSLSADGDDQCPISFTSVNDDSLGEDVSGPGTSSPSRGDWNGLYFDDGSDASILDHVEVRYAGSDEDWGAITVHGASPTLSDVTVREVAGDGVWISGGAAILTRVTVVGASGVAFEIDEAAEADEPRIALPAPLDEDVVDAADAAVIPIANEAEPNNELASATVLPLIEDPAGSGFWTSAVALGAIDPYQDNDYWSFSAQQGDQLV
ncbi:MAG: LEPR-XLL domain-containing protein, partial [Verrucomicrobiales bacterium]